MLRLSMAEHVRKYHKTMEHGSFRNALQVLCCKRNKLDEIDACIALCEESLAVHETPSEGG